jgi:hypothetical protein
MWGDDRSLRDSSRQRVSGVTMFAYSRRLRQHPAFPSVLLLMKGSW